MPSWRCQSPSCPRLAQILEHLGYCSPSKLRQCRRAGGRHASLVQWTLVDVSTRCHCRNARRIQPDTLIFGIDAEVSARSDTLAADTRRLTRTVLRRCAAHLHVDWLTFFAVQLLQICARRSTRTLIGHHRRHGGHIDASRAPRECHQCRNYGNCTQLFDHHREPPVTFCAAERWNLLFSRFCNSIAAAR